MNSPLGQLQCSGFGNELREILKSERKGRPPGQRERKLAGIILSELDRLAQFRADGRPHPNEKKCKWKISEISALVLYQQNESIRIYFVVISEIIWRLLLDTDKRQTKLLPATEDKLLKRLKEAKERDAERKSKP